MLSPETRLAGEVDPTAAAIPARQSPGRAHSEEPPTRRRPPPKAPRAKARLEPHSGRCSSCVWVDRPGETFPSDLELAVAGHQLLAHIDSREVASVTDATYGAGPAGIGRLGVSPVRYLRLAATRP